MIIGIVTVKGNFLLYIKSNEKKDKKKHQFAEGFFCILLQALKKQ